MKLKNSLEEAICILLILGKNLEGTRTKSAFLSQQLGVSDSYLKKILRKLVLGKIITSSVSKEGGFDLAKPLEDIYLLDVFYAIEGKDSYIRTQNLMNKVYGCEEEAAYAEQQLLRFFQESEEILRKRLANYSLADLVQKK